MHMYVYTPLYPSLYLRRELYELYILFSALLFVLNHIFYFSYFMAMYINISYLLSTGANTPLCARTVVLHTAPYRWASGLFPVLCYCGWCWCLKCTFP